LGINVLSSIVSLFLDNLPNVISELVGLPNINLFDGIMDNHFVMGPNKNSCPLDIHRKRSIIQDAFHVYRNSLGLCNGIVAYLLSFYWTLFVSKFKLAA